jgi:hypothetical protein
MFFTDSTYLGIDPTAGRKPLTYAALDDQLRLTSLGEGTLDEVLAILGGQSQAIAAVCAPRRPSQRLMGRPQVRDTLSPPPHPGRYVDFRVAEYLLRQHNISCYQTPAEEKDCPNWMQVGFQLYSRLEKMGYHAFPARGHALQWMEVYPHACYSALLGQVPLPKNSLEGRIQRQLALCQLHLNLPDPVEVLKKITTRSLLEGKRIRGSRGRGSPVGRGRNR